MTSAVLILALSGVGQLFHHKAAPAYATPQAPGKMCPPPRPRPRSCRRRVAAPQRRARSPRPPPAPARSLPAP